MMNIAKVASTALVTPLALGCYYLKISSFSTSSLLYHNVKTYKKKWVTTEEWEEVTSGNDEIPWLKSLPQRMNPDKWTQEEAYKGMYDYLPILGNDVTIRNKLFCGGPEYVRAFSGNELKRLLRKKRELGHRMHAEDLLTINKRIKYLMRVENEIKGLH